MGVRLEINEEMYVVEFNFCEYDNDFVIIGFEADAINLLHTFVFCKSPTNSTT